MTTLKMAARETGFYVVVWVSLRVCFLIFNITSFADRIIRAQHQKTPLDRRTPRGRQSSRNWHSVIVIFNLVCNSCRAGFSYVLQNKPKIYSLLRQTTEVN